MLIFNKQTFKPDISGLMRALALTKVKACSLVDQVLKAQVVNIVDQAMDALSEGVKAAPEHTLFTRIFFDAQANGELQLKNGVSAVLSNCNGGDHWVESKTKLPIPVLLPDMRSADFEKTIKNNRPASNKNDGWLLKFSGDGIDEGLQAELQSVLSQDIIINEKVKNLYREVLRGARTKVHSSIEPFHLYEIRSLIEFEKTYFQQSQQDYYAQLFVDVINLIKPAEYAMKALEFDKLKNCCGEMISLRLPTEVIRSYFGDEGYVEITRYDKIVSQFDVLLHELKERFAHTNNTDGLTFVEVFEVSFKHTIQAKKLFEIEKKVAESLNKLMAQVDGYSYQHANASQSNFLKALDLFLLAITTYWEGNLCSVSRQIIKLPEGLEMPLLANSEVQIKELNRLVGKEIARQVEASSSSDLSNSTEIVSSSTTFLDGVRAVYLRTGAGRDMFKQTTAHLSSHDGAQSLTGDGEKEVSLLSSSSAHFASASSQSNGLAVEGAQPAVPKT